MDLTTDLKETMGEVLGMAPSDIPEDATTQTLPGWDSQKHLLLVLTLEEKFGISFTTDEIVEIQSFPNLMRVVGERVGED